MFKKKTFYFPYDFYGFHHSGLFAIRANSKKDIIPAMYWLSYLTLHRDKINLLHISCGLFQYTNQLNEGKYQSIHPVDNFNMTIKRSGPIVDVKKLHEFQ